MERGHGPAVYGYGYGWFRRCLDAANADETMRRKERRLERAARFVDLRVAVHADKDGSRQHLQDITRKDES